MPDDAVLPDDHLVFLAADRGEVCAAEAAGRARRAAGAVSELFGGLS
jgi:hypothetical protein